MHRGYTAERYLARLADARRIVPDLAVSTDIIVGFPGETDDDFERTLEVAAAARFDDAFTFIFSPRPGTEAATMTDRFVAPGVAAERFARLRVVIERSSLAGNQRRVGRVEEVLVEGPSKKDPAVLAARTAQHRLVHFAAAVPGPRRVVRRGRGHRRRAAPPHRAARRRRRRAGAPVADPRRGRCDAPRRSSCSGRRRRASPTWRWPRRRAVAGTEIVAVDAMQVYRGMDIGTAKPTPADRARVPHHCLDLVEPSEEFTVTDYRAAYDRAVADDRRPTLLVAGTGLYLAAVVDRLDVPGRWPDVRAGWRRCR